MRLAETRFVGQPGATAAWAGEEGEAFRPGGRTKVSRARDSMAVAKARGSDATKEDLAALRERACPSASPKLFGVALW